jgi:hypothetical protein
MLIDADGQEPAFALRHWRFIYVDEAMNHCQIIDLCELEMIDGGRLLSQLAYE